MYIVYDNGHWKCSKCGSLSYERVTQFNERFLRCRDCGHEGSRTQAIPTTTDTSSGIVSYVKHGEGLVQKF